MSRTWPYLMKLGRRLKQARLEQTSPTADRRGHGCSAEQTYIGLETVNGKLESPGGCPWCSRKTPRPLECLLPVSLIPPIERIKECWAIFASRATPGNDPKKTQIQPPVETASSTHRQPWNGPEWNNAYYLNGQGRRQSNMAPSLELIPLPNTRVANG